MNITLYILTVLVFTQPQTGFDINSTVVVPQVVEEKLSSTMAECAAVWKKHADKFIEQIVEEDIGVIKVLPQCTPIEFNLKGGKSA